MRSTQGTLLEEDKSVGSGQLIDLEELDLHLAILAKDALNKPATPSGPDQDIHSSHHADSSPSKGTPSTASEIIVRIDGMDYDMDGPASAAVMQEEEGDELHPDKHAVDSHNLSVGDGGRKSFTSSASALSEQSDLSSPPSSSPSSKATTPVHVLESKESGGVPSQTNIARESLELQSQTDIATSVAPINAPSMGTTLAKPTATTTTSKKIKTTKPRATFDVRPKVSIPTDLAPWDYANQCIAAAEHSRLNPYALHPEEYSMLREHVSHAQVTTYLNIRNGILRLWLNNPRIGVAREEAIGCAKDPRWFDIANICYEWLLRRGYINYGCAEVPFSGKPAKKTSPKQKGKTVVVVGAGMAGLGCARQLESLFAQYHKEFQDIGQEQPKVVVLEGRNRLGGRVYSRAVDSSQSQRILGFQGKRHSVECGGMIITGFERGNPLNVLVRGQMGLPYYALRPETTLYDSNGRAVELTRDQMVEKLYNDCLERVSDYKFKNPPSKLIEGNRDLMDEGKDSSAEVHKTIAHVEEATALLPHEPPVSQQSLAPEVSLVPVSTDKTTGKTQFEPGTPATTKAGYKARNIGWELREGITEDKDLDLEAAAKDARATLGSLMDEAISQYRDIVDLTAQDFRLMNWHVANLEYSNATNYHQLSLGGWDIDAGNEWEGKHTMVVGGYQSVPWGLAQAPSPLNIRTNSVVQTVAYDPEGVQAAKIECEDGSVIEADYVISTIPLGVLKHGSVQFEPPLPSWKTDTIERLGYGILNKVILVYREAFWDTNRDIFGVLRNPHCRHSLKQRDYASRRGRFFQWFDVSHTSGVPVLLALMAGDAGFDTERTKNDELVAEATQVLRSVYGSKVTQPVQVIITRWGSDKFARGSYSSAGPNMKADDYDIMARRVGNLLFAGEHTTGTHPATVHGAYLSGIRAASDLIDTMLGPIEVPIPLILPKDSITTTSPDGLKRKTPPGGTSAALSPRAAKQARIKANRIAAYNHIVAQIGEYPWRPQKVSGNAYLLYSKANFEIARKRCGEGRRAGKGKPGPNEVRVMTSKMWKSCPVEERQPFEDEATQLKQAYNEKLKNWEEEAKEWDRKALEIRKKWEEENKLEPEDDVEGASGSGSGSGRERRGKMVGTYAESEGSDIEMEGANT